MAANSTNSNKLPSLFITLCVGLVLAFWPVPLIVALLYALFYALVKAVGWIISIGKDFIVRKRHPIQPTQEFRNKIFTDKLNTNPSDVLVDGIITMAVYSSIVILITINGSSLFPSSKIFTNAPLLTIAFYLTVLLFVFTVISIVRFLGTLCIAWIRMFKSQKGESRGILAVLLLGVLAYLWCQINNTTGYIVLMTAISIIIVRLAQHYTKPDVDKIATELRELAKNGIVERQHSSMVAFYEDVELEQNEVSSSPANFYALLAVIVALLVITPVLNTVTRALGSEGTPHQQAVVAATGPLVVSTSTLAVSTSSATTFTISLNDGRDDEVQKGVESVLTSMVLIALASLWLWIDRNARRSRVYIAVLLACKRVIRELEAERQRKALDLERVQQLLQQDIAYEDE